MESFYNYCLKDRNTFGIDVLAQSFHILHNIEDIRSFCKRVTSSAEPFLIMGGGSNLLFTRDFPGNIGQVAIPGINILSDNEKSVLIEAGAGEDWDGLVSWACEKGYCGIENLSAIPGCTGAAPVQNIGAYGCELKDVFHSLTAVNIQTGNSREFIAAECRFGYRDSIFKTELRNQYIIVSVRLSLGKKCKAVTGYGSIQSELQAMGVRQPLCSDIREAVCRIRASKLPDVKETGSAGSFFKNPVIENALFLSVQEQFPEIPYYPDTDEKIKIPAGWLIEHCGWKSYTEGSAGVYPKQALILVNYGGASGYQILRLAEKIRASVWEKFGILLEPEVNII